jgi:magnesium chelatase family protein
MVKAISFVHHGLEGVRAEVIARPIRGPLNLVGPGGLALRETAVRLRYALESAGISTSVEVEYRLPECRATASWELDLAAACAAAAATGALPEDALEGLAFLGELALDGRIRGFRGLLPCALAARAAGLRVIAAPVADAVAWCDCAEGGARIAPTLTDVIDALRGGADLWSVSPVTKLPRDMTCWSELAGNDASKRVAEIAAAGGHSLVLVGAPGCGKTMLARRIPTILPDLTHEQAREVACVSSVAGLMVAPLQSRPFRAPRHTVSDTGMLGGGDPARPGEVGLAHHGALFLDELSEFRRDVFEAAHGAYRRGSVETPSGVRFPSRMLLVAAENPCFCGMRSATLPSGSSYHPRCRCTAEQMRRHAHRAGKRIAEFDLVARFEMRDGLAGAERGKLERSETVRARVAAARERQLARQGRLNGEEPRTHRDDAATLASVARTIADLEGCATEERHYAEAAEIAAPAYAKTMMA